MGSRRFIAVPIAVILGLAVVACGLLLIGSSGEDKVTRPQELASGSLTGLPAAFVPNRGQWEPWASSTSPGRCRSDPEHLADWRSAGDHLAAALECRECCPRRIAGGHSDLLLSRPGAYLLTPTAASTSRSRSKFVCR